MSVTNIPAATIPQQAQQASQQTQPDKNYTKPNVPVINPVPMSKTPIKDKLDKIKVPKDPTKAKEILAKNSQGDELVKMPEELEEGEKEKAKEQKQVGGNTKNIFKYIVDAALIGGIAFGGFKAFKHFAKSGAKEIENATKLSTYKQNIEAIIKQRALKAKDFTNITLNINEDTPKREAVENILHVADKFASVNNVSPKVTVFLKKGSADCEEDIIEELKSGSLSGDTLEQISSIELSKLTNPETIATNSIIYDVKPQSAIDANSLVDTTVARIKHFFNNLGKID